ncbi:hypothetical protein BKP35_03270 [Anaerobacillus arseniciselenatis]|uniref:Uncharacterized protein n=1 Tax=Anaerobacillus arseniciselenatis TaxID=85682 RepID=A0A1S2LUJ4_9BACI|nr:hypothetical protein [Anaerobacillus arseniciselenatis]OIJ16016.1 hypothetical protein BKP35_03270 [Anaerobacillus arseniciselenatis]
MKNMNVIYFLSIIFYLVVGIIIGIVVDKDWLSDEQLLYIQKLKAENALLVEENQTWARYVEDEFNEVRVFTTAEKEQFQHLDMVLAKVGVTLERFPETAGLYNQQGIIITLGEELEETYGLPQLKLEDIPNRELDLNMMYISLLRIKEELMK